MVTPEVYMIAPFTLAYQLKKENLVEVHDWVHNVDSSTIYGTVIGFIHWSVNPRAKPEDISDWRKPYDMKCRFKYFCHNHY